jgi:hypothetical protein
MYPNKYNFVHFTKETNFSGVICYIKKEELCNLIDSSNPSMIIGTETWLRKDISSSEIFPDSYTVQLNL